MTTPIRSSSKPPAAPVVSRTGRAGSPLGEIRATATLQTALATLRRSGSHLARLIDDNGQTQAVIAFADILEQLVGEVMDATRRPDASSRPDQPFS